MTTTNLERPEPRIENLTLWERVYDHLREEILANRLPPGTELQEIPLARSLGMSRGPVREAIGRLAAEGLVAVRPRRGAVVRPLSSEEFLDAYQVREALERLGMELAVPRLKAEDFDRLSRLNRTMARQAAREDVRGFLATNQLFHQSLIAVSGNHKLQEVHGQLMAQMGRYLMRSYALRGNLEESVSGHRVILRAARAGDMAQAVELLVEHIRMPRRRMEARSSEELVALGMASEREGAAPTARASAGGPAPA